MGAPETAFLEEPVAAIVCRKCVRRAGGKEDGAGKRLSKQLRKRTGQRLRVLDSSCLGICPDDAVVVLAARDLRDNPPRATLVPLEGIVDWLEAVFTDGKPD